MIHEKATATYFCECHRGYVIKELEGCMYCYAEKEGVCWNCGCKVSENIRGSKIKHKCGRTIPKRYEGALVVA